jgi:SAM-dependent methyltransferase
MAHPLVPFYETAKIHAMKRFGRQLDWNGTDGLKQVDSVLDACRINHEQTELESLVLCYGAWFGEWIVKSHSGKWINWDESTPPRVWVHHQVVSPLNAVKRRLLGEDAPKLVDLAHQLQGWADDVAGSHVSIHENRLAWNRRSFDVKFAHQGAWSMSSEQAIAAIDPWIREEGAIQGMRILCLGAGGGTHGPLHAAAGADVTVVDFSSELLAIDRWIATQCDLRLNVVEASMEDLSSLGHPNFDCVLQPVSTCYVRDIEKVYREISRVLRAGGLYVSQHKSPTLLQTKMGLPQGEFFMGIPYVDGAMVEPSVHASPFRENEMTEFVHTLDSMIGGMCRSGFAIENLTEPSCGDAWATMGSPEHLANFVSPYVKIKARLARGKNSS